MTGRASGLIVPVESVREVVAPWLGLLPTVSRELPPHVTALWPFLPADALDAHLERELEALLAGVAPFDFALSRVGGFTDVSYLAPEPTEPFVSLTRLLWERWPECPPFGGAYDEIVPHLTVALDPTAGERLAIETDLAARLPVAGRAEEVVLVEETAAGALRKRRRFALGGGFSDADGPTLT
jgi:hypothetical protein